MRDIISIHSLTRRLTTPLHRLKEISVHFNSQPHKEADHSGQSQGAWGKEISIHSLTRRLTTPLHRLKEISVHFNSQPHKEADHSGQSQGAWGKEISIHSLTRRLTLYAAGINADYIFQFTASQGG